MRWITSLGFGFSTNIIPPHSNWSVDRHWSDIIESPEWPDNSILNAMSLLSWIMSRTILPIAATYAFVNFSYEEDMIDLCQKQNSFETDSLYRHFHDREGRYSEPILSFLLFWLGHHPSWGTVTINLPVTLSCFETPIRSPVLCLEHKFPLHFSVFCHATLLTTREILIYCHVNDS